MENANFIENYMFYCSNTEIPNIFSKFMAMLLLSTVTKGKVFFNNDKIEIYPNLYLFLVNNLSNSRNTTMKNITIELLDKVNSKIYSKIRMLNEKYSFNYLLEHIEKNQNYSDDTSIFLTNNISDIFTKSEESLNFLNFLTLTFKSRTSISYLFNSKNYNFNNLFINLILITNQTEIQFYIEKLSNSIFSDYYAISVIFGRCLTIVNSEEIKKIANPTLNKDIENNLVNHLIKVNQLYGNMTLNKEAKQCFNSWYSQISYDIPKEFISTFYLRLNDFVLKFAMIFNLSEDADLIIKESQINNAINIINEIKDMNLSKYLGLK